MCTIAGAKVQLNHNCYNVYFNECLPNSAAQRFYYVKIWHHRTRLEIRCKITKIS